MVLLDEKKPELTPLRKKVRLAFKILIVVALLFGASLYVLAALGGNHEALKKGIEDYLQKATHMEASIGRFDYMGFYPDIRVDIGDIKLTKIDHKKPSATLETLQFSMRFWDLFFSRYQANELFIEGLYLDKGIKTAKPLEVSKLSLEESADSGKPAMVINGLYDGVPFSGQLEMAMTESGDKKRFFRPDRSEISFHAEPLQVKGVMTDVGGGKLDINLSHIGMPDNIADGMISMRGSKTSFNLKSGKSRLNGELKTNKKDMNGKVDVDILDIDDIVQLYSLYESYNKFVYGGDEPLDFGEQAVDIAVDIKSLISDKIKIGDADFNIKIADNIFTVGPLGGVISQGRLSGQLTIDAQQSPAKLSAKADIDKLDYGVLSQALSGKSDFKGTANVKLSLESTAKTSQELINNMKGEVIAIAGKGTFAGGLLNLWGAGLLNVMLPSLDPESEMVMNCMIADFKIENGVAITSPLFLDTKRVTITGDGVVDFVENKVDIKLKPETKDISIGTITSVPVRLSGPFGNVTAGPDALGLGTALGKLFLGTVNPAFMVFSMTDLGLTENHPCHKFIGTAEE